MNKNAGFWIRLFLRVCDSIFVFSVLIAFAFLFLENQNSNWYFKQDYLFYVWILILASFMFIWFILIPFFWNGQTLFMKLFKVKINFKSKQKFISLLRRELFFSLSWIFMSLFVMIVINHQLIIKFAITNRQGIVFSNWEQIRISIVTSIASILMIIQFILFISIIIRKNKIALHDSYSSTETVWTNKFLEKEERSEIIEIKPRPIKNNPIIWLKTGESNE